MEAWQKEILNSFTNKQDPIDFLLTHQSREYMYHVSPVRSNLLAWYPFKENMRVAEINSGTGALGTMIVPYVKEYTCVEKDPDLQLIAKIRYKDYKNVDYCSELDPAKKYDVIIVTGDYRLEEIKNYIASTSILLLAFDNPLSLSRLSGNISYEEKAPYEALEAGKGITKKAMCAFLERYNCSYTFYYPYPDYIFTKEIYSDGHLPKLGDLYGYSYDYKENETMSFDENKVRNLILKEEKYPEYANSYLVEVKCHAVL